MTNPHTTLSEAVRALPCKMPDYRDYAMGSYERGCHRDGYRAGHRAALKAAAALVEQHEAQEPKLPTDISNRLRDVATGGDQYYTNTANSLLRAAADEIERYYGGMMNWKWNAQHKDTQMAEYRAKLAEQPTLAATQAGNMSAKWGYCPECGSEEVRHEEGEHKQCAACRQEWFADIDYTDVVRGHLAKRTQAGDAWISVQDRLPPRMEGREFSENVLVVNMNSSWPHVTISECNYYEGENTWRGVNVTHWMPLPPAPTTTRSE